MSARVFGVVSHKGGTGRTTATANVAYRLALQGVDVCCVDLDLTSSTFGAVLGLGKDLERGGDVGTHDFLHEGNARVDGRIQEGPRSPAEAPSRVVGVFSRRKDLQPRGAGAVGDFDLLPGRRQHLAIERNPHRLGRLLTGLLDALRPKYQVIFADVRSGTSDVVKALVSIGGGPAKLHAWLVYYRWTIQHVSSATSLCRQLEAQGQSVHAIRTAYTDVSDLGEVPAWYRDRNRELLQRAREEHLDGYQLTDGEGLDISIPLERALQWREMVVTDRMVDEGIARAETTQSYQAIAEAVRVM